MNFIRGLSDKIVVVKFGAQWCPPCRNLEPLLENLANEFSGNLNVIFVSADVDKCGGAAHEYQVSSIPDTRIFVNGQEKKKVVGADIQ